MKLCKIENLAIGDILAKAVITSDYQILLAEETRLSADYIEKLKKLGILEVYIRSEKLKEAEAVVILKRNVEKVFREKVKDILEKHTYSNNEELKKLSQEADSIICNILEEQEVVEKIFDIKERSSDIYEHSISTCTLATLLALKMQLSREVVHDIGVACLLHDLGHRYMIYDYGEKKQTHFSAVEMAEYKKHPIYGYSTVKEEPWISDLSKETILYHHERLDGSGYPLKIKDIPWETQIVAVCDCFDEMICGIYCKRSKIHEAVEYLKVFKGAQFDERIVDVFLEFIAVYPVGTCVMTSNGQVGVVIRQNQEFSDRPVLKMIKDEEGNALVTPKEVNLVYATTIFIEKVLD